jgi:hypothetical protein
MKNAKELLEEFTAASFRDPKQAAEMFTEDGAFEIPYLESFGFPGRYEGREAMRVSSASFANSIPTWTLKISQS